MARLPLGPMVNLAPRGPNEREPPDLLRFKVTPGAILIRLQKRKLIQNVLLSFGDMDPSRMFAPSGAYRPKSTGFEQPGFFFEQTQEQFKRVLQRHRPLAIPF